MGIHFRNRWTRLLAAILISTVGNVLITLLISGKDALLNWHGVINIIGSSALFLVILMWLTPNDR